MGRSPSKTFLDRPRLSVTRTLAGLALLFSPWAAHGAPGVVLDGSFGASGALPGPNYLITAGMGRQVGSNLFQSFSSFNLTSSESATFTGPAQIQNILARVTGGPSSIDGTINSDIAGANLFLLNPSGVIFGAHAQVNVTGAFAVSTADYVTLGSLGKFSTSLGGSDNLTSAPVSAFGFLAAHPAAIQMTGSRLGVNPGTGLDVIGGDITLTNTLLNAPSGRLSLFSAGGPGVVPFSVSTSGSGFAAATNTSFGNISLTNCYLDIDGNGGGAIAMRGGQMTVDEAGISAYNGGSIAGGDISIQALQLTLQNGGEIYSTNSGTGSAGDISIRTASLTLNGIGTPAGDETAITSYAYSGATGNAGSVDVTATGAMSLLNGAQISTTTAAGGGGIAVQAATLDIDGSGTPTVFTGISTASFTNHAEAGSQLSVVVSGAMNLAGGAQISSSAFSRGAGANVVVDAGSLAMEGSASTYFTGLESESGASGSGGSMTVDVAGALTLADGANIYSATFASGTGGAISVHAASLAVTGSDVANFVTGIQSTTDSAGTSGSISIGVTGAMTLTTDGVISNSGLATGSTGNVTIHAGSLSVTDDSNILTYSQSFGGVPNPGSVGSISVTVDQALQIQNGGLIGSNTSSVGNAGAITVQAGSLSIYGTGSPNVFTGIADQTFSGASGNAGSVTVNVLGALTIQNGGAIGSNTFSSGHGGNVAVQAGSLDIDGMNSTALTGISSNADTGATGNGGSLSVYVDGDLTISRGGEISSTTFSAGNSGSLIVDAGGALTLLSDGEISGGTFSAGASGAISVRANSLLIDSQGEGAVLTGISDQSGTGATGSAGPLTIDIAGAAVLEDGGEISSGTKSVANGGDVTVNAGSLTIEDAVDSAHLTGITSETDGTKNSQGQPTGQGGDAGSVNVTVAGALVITSGKIDTDTFCSGNAGDVTVHAGSLSIDGSATPHALVGIFSDSNGYVGDVTDSGGNAGSVNIGVSGRLSLTNRGKIGAATLTRGEGGDINVRAGSIIINGAFTGITAQALGIGNGGSVTLDAGSVALANHGVVTSSSRLSNAGSIEINASTLTLQAGSSLATVAEMNGGDITLNVGNLVYLIGSQITAAAGRNGGNILIDPEFVVLNDSLISANAAIGEGGNITIISNYFFDTNSSITATGSTTDGTITITAPDFDLAGNLLVLPGDLVQAEKELRERCARSLNHEFSSLIVVGRGGVEASPDELQPDFGADSLPLPSSLTP